MHRNSWMWRGNAVSEKGHAKWWVSNLQVGAAALLSLEPFTQCCSFTFAGRCSGPRWCGGYPWCTAVGPALVLLHKGWSVFPFSLWHCPTARSAPPHSSGRERLKEILSLSALIYYTYTYRNMVAFLLGIPLRAAVKLYAQPSALLKGMSEDPGHHRFDPTSKTASPASYLPRGRGTGGAALF